VYGDQSCVELPKFNHCRNCAVFSDGALRLLDRPLPGQYRREWTAHFAEPKRTAPPRKSSALIFRINVEWFALPAPAFQEVAQCRLVHSLPHRRDGVVLGLVNIRGELLICVSLGRLLGLESTPSQESPRRTYERLLVVNWENARLVFPVDEVHGVHRFRDEDLKERPATVAKSSVSYTQGLFSWRERTVGFLDASLLFPALNRSLL
jgi:chemotaxis-related protein WspD